MVGEKPKCSSHRTNKVSNCPAVIDKDLQRFSFLCRENAMSFRCARIGSTGMRCMLLLPKSQVQQCPQKQQQLLLMPTTTVRRLELSQRDKTLVSHRNICVRVTPTFSCTYFRLKCFGRKSGRSDNKPCKYSLERLLFKLTAQFKGSQASEAGFPLEAAAAVVRGRTLRIQ